MTQLHLFVETVPAAARLDPETSHLAAREINESGARGAQCQMVLECVRKHPGLTSMELSNRYGLDRHLIAKRLPDLEQTGKVFKGVHRKCTRSGRLAITWYPMKFK